MSANNAVEYHAAIFWQASQLLRRPVGEQGDDAEYLTDDLEGVAIHATGLVRALADRELRLHGKHREADRAAILSAGGWVEDDEAVG